MSNDKPGNSVVSVRFTESELRLVRAAAGERAVSNFIRSAAIEAAKRLAAAGRVPLGINGSSFAGASFVTNAPGWSGPVTDGIQLSPSSYSPSR